ncbi:MAG: adenylate/guanylate cyclase domain-containing protein [Vulcanimicrobiaceae bacterium]|jgi:class 3 adenylate cyclase
MRFGLALIAVSAIVIAAIFFSVQRAAFASPVLDLDTAQLDPDAIQPTEDVSIRGAEIPFDYFVDDEYHPASIEDVASKTYQARFKPWTATSSLGSRYASGWVRFRLRSHAAKQAWIIVTSGTLNVADLYVPDARGAHSLFRFGRLIPFAHRSLKTLPYAAIIIPQQAMTGQPLFLHFSYHGVGGHLFLGAARYDEALVTQYDINVSDAVYVGIFLAFALTNLLLFVYLRDGAFLAYVFFMLVSILMNLVPSQLAWKFIWPWAAVPIYPTESIVYAAVSITLYNFGRLFLDLPRRVPLLHIAVLLALILDVVCVIYPGVTPQLSSTSVVNWLIYGPDVLFYCLLIASGFVVWRKGFQPARFYLLAIGGLFFILYGVVAVAYVNIPAALNTVLAFVQEWGGNVAFIWDALFLTFALADRIQTANRDTVRALSEKEYALEKLASGQEQMVARLNTQNIAMERFVPRAFLQHLGKASVEDLNLGDHILREMTLLFSDIRSFTTLAESMSAQETFDFLNSYLTRVGPVIRDHNGFIDKYIGDAIMALFPESTNDAVDTAIALQVEVAHYNQMRARAGYRAIAIGVGLHHGTLALGTIGETERIETTVIADAVNVASRMEGLTKMYGSRIIASDAVIAKLEDPEQYRLRSLGHVQVKGTTHGVEIFEIFDADQPELILQKLQSQESFSDAVAVFARGDFEKAEAVFDRIASDAPDDRAAAHFAQRCRDLKAFRSIESWDGVERLESK